MNTATKLSRGTGFWVVAVTFLLTMAYTTIPTPLYLIYQARDGFPTYVITVIFAAYAIGVVVSLYLAGHLSDWLGRRTMIRAATLLEALSAAMFLAAHGVEGLLVARMVSGLGIGAMTATATAYLAELAAPPLSAPRLAPAGRAPISRRTDRSSVGRPGTEPPCANRLPAGSTAVGRADDAKPLSTLVSTAFNTGGLALGPLVSGVLAQTVSAPLVAPYALFLGLLLAAALAVSAVPETVHRHEHLRTYRPQRLSAAGGGASGLFAAAAGVVAGFAILGMYTSLSPSFAAHTMHVSSRAVAGIVSASVFAAATAAQIAFARAGRRAQLLAGLIAMTGGLVLTALGVELANVAVFLAAGLASGAGAGLMLLTSIATASALAPPDQRGSLLAFVYLVGYLGLALPVIALGVSLLVLPTPDAVILFSAGVLLLVLFSAARTLESLRTANRPKILRPLTLAQVQEPSPLARTVPACAWGPYVRLLFEETSVVTRNEGRAEGELLCASAAPTRMSSDN